VRRVSESVGSHCESQDKKDRFANLRGTRSSISLRCTGDVGYHDGASHPAREAEKCFLPKVLRCCRPDDETNDGTPLRTSM